jgi:hypothetical protein
MEQSRDADSSNAVDKIVETVLWTVQLTIYSFQRVLRIGLTATRTYVLYVTSDLYSAQRSVAILLPSNIAYTHIELRS